MRKSQNLPVWGESLSQDRKGGRLGNGFPLKSNGNGTGSSASSMSISSSSSPSESFSNFGPPSQVPAMNAAFKISGATGTPDCVQSAAKVPSDRFSLSSLPNSQFSQVEQAHVFALTIQPDDMEAHKPELTVRSRSASLSSSTYI